MFGITINEKQQIVKNIYVGQANLRKNGEAIWGRINEHDTMEQSYWSEAIVFIDKSNRWSGTAISFLENRIATLVKKAKEKSDCYLIRNKNEPNIGYVPEETSEKMEQYLEGFIKILQIMGYDFFETEDDLELGLSDNNGANITHPNNKTGSVTKRIVRQKTFSQIDNGKKSTPQSPYGVFPFKIGQVMTFAFRKAIEKGLLKNEIGFLESQEASKRFKTRGFKVIVSGEEPKKDSSGVKRYATTPVYHEGKKYWITTQVYAEGLEPLLAFLEKHGMKKEEIINLCQKGCHQRKHQTNKKTCPAESVSFDKYLTKTMARKTALNYISAFKCLEKRLIEAGIIVKPVVECPTPQVLDRIRKYISEDSVFLEHNRRHHHSYSAAWKRFEDYIIVGKQI